MHHIRMFLDCLSTLIQDLSKKFSAHSPKFRATLPYIKNDIYFTGYVELFVCSPDYLNMELTDLCV
jgi:hypothetical protein